MTLFVTDAVVLHVADYLESSRIYRLATREAGVQSVLGRGARTSRKRFGSALDLFAQGTAQIQVKQGRELHTLMSFDVMRVRPALAADMGRFTAASALAECVLRVVHEEAAPRAFDTVADGLDLIAAAPEHETVGIALGVIWRLVSEVGFTPELSECADCHAPIEPTADALFSHLAGGVLCPLCNTRVPGGRRLPATARAAIRRWIAAADEAADGAPGADAVRLDEAEGRAHQRLLREFLSQHLTDARALKAFAIWEQGGWSQEGVGSRADAIRERSVLKYCPGIGYGLTLPVVHPPAILSVRR